MKTNSKLVKVYVYFYFILAIVLGISVFFYLPIFFKPLGLSTFYLYLLSAFVGLIVIGFSYISFFLESNFFLLKSFLEGEVKGIKFQMYFLLAGLVFLLIFYNRFINSEGFFVYSILIIFGLIQIIFDFLRLRELN